MHTNSDEISKGGTRFACKYLLFNRQLLNLINTMYCGVSEAVVNSSNVSPTKKLTCPTTLGSAGSYRLLSQLKQMAKRRQS